MVKVNKNDIETIQAEWQKSIKFDEVKEHEEEKKEEPVEPEFQKAPQKYPTDIIKNPNYEPGTVPSREWTGVDPSITQICASLSQQIYDATHRDDFRLETDNGDVAEVTIFDNHGDLDETIPAFAVAHMKDTLVMGWRGSTKVMDFVTDAAMAPVVSREFGKAATGIRAHAMFTSLVGSDLKVHEDEIISYIKRHRIMNIVFTGHSLGGGLASTAHLFLKAFTGGYNDQSPWKGLSRLALRSVTFAAPMSIFDYDEVGVTNEDAESLIQEVGSKTVNFIFNCDVVPRAYGHTSYIYAVITKIAPELINGAVGNALDGRWTFGLGGRLGRRAERKLSPNVVQFLVDQLEPLIPVAMKFRHSGTLLYYPDQNATEPLALADTGPVEQGCQKSKDAKNLNYHSFDSYQIPHGECAKTLLEAHSHFPAALSPFISKETKQE